MAKHFNQGAMYFTHAVNMRNHFKILNLRRKFGSDGYCMWCMLLEVLSVQEGFELELDELNREIYSEDFALGRELFDSIYEQMLRLQLLVEEDGVTYSPSLKEYMAGFSEYRQQQKEYGKSGAKKRWEEKEGVKKEGVKKGTRGSRTRSTKKDRPPIGPPSDENRVPIAPPSDENRGPMDFDSPPIAPLSDDDRGPMETDSAPMQIGEKHDMNEEYGTKIAIDGGPINSDRPPIGPPSEDDRPPYGDPIGSDGQYRDRDRNRNRESYTQPPPARAHVSDGGAELGAFDWPFSDAPSGHEQAEEPEEKPGIPPAPYDEIEQLWNAERGDLPEIRGIGGTRRRQLDARWAEMAELGDPWEVIEAVVVKMRDSRFIQGGGPKGWKGSFDWLVANDNNWRKVLEGNYDDAPMGSPGERPDARGRTYVIPEGKYRGRRLGPLEFIESGKRYFTEEYIAIPMDQPPRCGTECWDAQLQRWNFD